jgi:hypothetical protein
MAAGIMPGPYLSGPAERRIIRMAALTCVGLSTVDAAPKLIRAHPLPRSSATPAFTAMALIAPVGSWCPVSTTCAFVRMDCMQCRQVASPCAQVVRPVCAQTPRGSTPARRPEQVPAGPREQRYGTRPGALPLGPPAAASTAPQGASGEALRTMRARSASRNSRSRYRIG